MEGAFEGERRVPWARGAGLDAQLSRWRNDKTVWPHLVVSGIMGGTRNARGAVRINNQLLNVGDVVDGVKITAITRHGVQLEYAGESRTLAAGDTTD